MCWERVGEEFGTNDEPSACGERERVGEEFEEFEEFGAFGRRSTPAMSRQLVAGVDSSTQSCKVVIRDAESGELVREGRATHPTGTEIDPAAWWSALTEAASAAGGLDDVAALSVAAQQHGMVCLDAAGDVVRPALLWNDTRSAPDADELVSEAGDGDRALGAKAWAEAVGLVPVASFTVTKLRWLAAHEPDNAARTAAVCLPHDWLTWKLRHDGDEPTLDTLTTDRSDASGTGYWSPMTGQYRLDLLARAFGATPALPTVLGPRDIAGATARGLRLGVGAGDNAAAALGVGAAAGDVVVSGGTSGTVFGVSERPTADASGQDAGIADATGRFLPLVATLNAARVLDATASMLGVDTKQLAELALSAMPGAGGLVVVPYLEGERTPNRPLATGAIHGWRLGNSTAADLARAAFEGVLCGLADGLDAMLDHGFVVRRLILIGGAARSEAIRRIAPTVLGLPVVVPAPGEYVADGAARQAAWALLANEEPPSWTSSSTEIYEADAAPRVREQYAEVRDLTAIRH
ncbi:MAG: xylulokinase [Actinomycetota bacterium]|nr:xylulokinase [Actinomycetota bacterium]